MRQVEHTADLGMEVEADSLEELFRGAAVGMFSLICELRGVRETEAKEIALSAGELEELMFTWLNELLYLEETDLVLFSDFDIKRVSPTSIEAIALGERYDPARHVIKNEIKAATYHMLLVEESGGSWRAKVIFDV